ncbi:MAG: transposase [Microscillaceae bacterium]|nr:transposase [Microscillaceae bacterium]
MNTILWLVLTGAQSQNLPPQFPIWQIVYYHFQPWGQQ